MNSTDTETNIISGHPIAKLVNEMIYSITELDAAWERLLLCINHKLSYDRKFVEYDLFNKGAVVRKLIENLSYQHDSLSDSEIKIALKYIETISRLQKSRYENMVFHLLRDETMINI